MNKYLVKNFKWRENLGKVPAKVYRLVSDHLAGYKKLKLYDECCDQLLLSGEPNSAYIDDRDTFHGRSEKSFDEDDVTWHCCKGLLSA